MRRSLLGFVVGLTATLVGAWIAVRDRRTLAPYKRAPWPRRPMARWLPDDVLPPPSAACERSGSVEAFRREVGS